MDNIPSGWHIYNINLRGGFLKRFWSWLRYGCWDSRALLGCLVTNGVPQDGQSVEVRGIKYEIVTAKHFELFVRKLKKDFPPEDCLYKAYGVRQEVDHARDTTLR